jgi:hypothetical protein
MAESAHQAIRERQRTEEATARANLIDEIRDIARDASADAETVQLARSIVTNADRLGLIWKLRPGTITTSASNGSPRVILDGTSQPIRCMSLLGPMMVGTRVITILSPPAGCHVIGLGGLTGWKSMSLMNGWYNRTGYQPMSYRVPPSPPNSVQLIGNMGIGTSTNGVQIGLMPKSYRPLSITTLSCYGGQSATLTPKIEIDSAGVVRAYDFTTAGWFGINGFYPIDL